MKKECIILGYAPYEEKETLKKMLRILIGTNSDKENYKGIMVAPPVYLDYKEELVNLLNAYLDDESKQVKAYYKTTDNIFTGKTKVSDIIIEL